MPSDLVQLIDIDELSVRLKVAKGTLYNWVYLRRIPHLKVGRCLRFNPNDVDRMVREMSSLERADRGRRST